MSWSIGFWRGRVRGTERARDVSDACLVAAVGLLLIAVGVTGAWTPFPGTSVSPWWHVVSLTAICAVMLVKRRHPLLALLAGGLVFIADAAAGGSIGVLLGFIDLMYSATLFTAPKVPRRLAIAVVVAVTGAATATVIVGGGVQAAVVNALQAFAILGTPLWWGISVRQQKEIAEMASARAADLQRLTELRESEAIREERMRMARDLHDALAGNLSAIAINSEAALASTGGGDDALQREALGVVRSASVASLREMRSMVLLLRAGPDSVTSPPRLAELGALAESLGSRGTSVSVNGLTGVPTLPAAVDQAAYRIAQEALGNAARHAQGATVRVDIGATPATLTLRITNPRADRAERASTPSTVGGAAVDVSPASSTHGGGMGLTTMRERAEALGGRFEAGWTDGSDEWTVTATLPLPGAMA
ncbi:sensor histidine kinase [Mycetocola zhujimingii]|uniref:histidine kinase n=1 Tax=Mycetocola zhujimingii TaxID=2079792 RepID=A0A2U1TB87_9MICO|nr:histidine kinase [Mycetocola zhujimingii]PWC06151.1 two-component sensor histidine kinase [Mycetocola zhujimingii]